MNQFGNPANPAAHEATTGPEIVAQLGGRLDAMVCGVGSGGTITGLPTTTLYALLTFLPGRRRVARFGAWHRRTSRASTSKLTSSHEREQP